MENGIAIPIEIFILLFVAWTVIIFLFGKYERRKDVKPDKKEWIIGRWNKNFLNIMRDEDTRTVENLKAELDFTNSAGYNYVDLAFTNILEIISDIEGVYKYSHTRWIQERDGVHAFVLMYLDTDSAYENHVVRDMCTYSTYAIIEHITKTIGKVQLSEEKKIRLISDIAEELRRGDCYWEKQILLRMVYFTILYGDLGLVSDSDGFYCPFYYVNQVAVNVYSLEPMMSYYTFKQYGPKSKTNKCLNYKERSKRRKQNEQKTRK